MAKKKLERPDNLFCRDCVHATDFHERGYDGKFFLCKCKFHQWSRFLNRDWCEHFEKKHG